MANESLQAKKVEYGVETVSCGLCQTKVPVNVKFQSRFKGNYKGVSAGANENG